MTQTDPRALVNLAREAEQRGDATRSLQLYDDALTLLGDERDLPLLADALRWKGTLHREQGETEIAYRCYKQSLMHAETCGSVNCRALVLKFLANIDQRRGNDAESDRLYGQGFEMA
jgi:tetratricopeptide (TPR) repeat protein